MIPDSVEDPDDPFRVHPKRPDRVGMSAGDAGLPGQMHDAFGASFANHPLEIALAQQIDGAPLDISTGGQLLAGQMRPDQDVPVTPAFADQMPTDEAGCSDDQDAHA
jgi:hypothetical protein